jgi:hypothetical protein
MSRTNHRHRPYTFVSTLILEGAIFILYFVESEQGGYDITCINDKSVEPMHIIKTEDGTWHLTGLPALITPLMTEKLSTLIEEHQKKDNSS